MFIKRLAPIFALALLSACAMSPKPAPMSPMATAPAAAATVSQPRMPAMASSTPAPAPTQAATPAKPAPTAVTVHAAQPAAPAVHAKPVMPASSPSPQSATHRMAHVAPPPRHVHRSHVSQPAHRHVASKPVPKPTQPHAAAIHGTVTLTASRGSSPSPADLTDTLVYYVPARGGARTHPGHYTIYTDHHQFDPRAMAIPLGSTISFVNLDSVDHNVFSVTPGNTFNLGYQSHGQTTSHTFGHAGLVLINCNVHPAMEVDVLVEPTPYVATVTAAGSFVLRGLPTGSGTVYAWNPRARIASEATSVASAAPVALHLTLRRPRVKTSLYTGTQP